ncbi:TolC family protein [Hydrogenimonas thermophila]|uniref:TolC family protein n=1 Tax=Hydrogenimonas thermophila TaxID=223786 RepID=UPI0029374525|nr:TolC family protein [Hydrogenimonas thermophila]WOE71142.1 TolC family protein [Hydrogenimonas thermophila]WOE73660.1 TolC family protein [Hydrogenimonas thermophila]
MKYLMTIFLCTISSFAASYMEFEKSIIQNAPLMGVYRLEKSASKLKERIALRCDNPSFEWEINNFSSDNGKNDNGFRSAISQSIRTFGYEKSLKEYANTLKLLAKKGYEKNRAKFLVELRRYFTEYVKAVHTKALLKDEIALYKRLESIAKTRFENGAISRTKLMQASLQRISAETKLFEIEREIDARYYDLMSITGVKKSIPLDANFIYPINYVTVNDANIQNAELDALEALKKQYEAKAKMQNRKLKTYRLFATYEDDIDQSIVTFGAGIDLPLFNQNREEYQLAKIKAQKAYLKKVQLKNSQQKRLKSLIDQLLILKKEYIALKKRALKEQELLTLFEEGYRTAQSSLLDIIQTQRSLINTKRKLLETEYLTNLYHIEIDYLKGRLK